MRTKRGSYQKWTQGDTIDLARLWHENATRIEIAEFFGCSEDAISGQVQRMRAAGMELKRRFIPGRPHA